MMRKTRPWRGTVGVAIALAGLCAAPAQDAPVEPRAQGARPAQADAAQQAQIERARRYAALQQKVFEAFAAKQYEQALAACDELIVAFPKDASALYNRACALARLGRPEDAITAVETAIGAGYADAAHIRSDPDLESLRDDPRLARMLAAAREKELAAPYEKGKPIEGLRMVEDFPEGGLRYRLRLSSSATAGKPHRLIVWMHPSGGSMNAQVEAIAPRLAESGFALLVLTRKDFRGWSEEDVRRLWNVTLPAAATTPGLDGRRPILLGYSAGGQAALDFYRGHAAEVGGLILDAAYPMSIRGGRLSMLAPPEGSGVADAPVFAVVGATDSGSMFWQMAEPAWRKAGVALTLHYVPNKGHAWLFDKERTDALAAWLSQVAAGGKPSGVTGTLAVPKRVPSGTGEER